MKIAPTLPVLVGLVLLTLGGGAQDQPPAPAIGCATLSWPPSTEAGIEGYRVRIGGERVIDAGSSSEVIVSGLTQGESYTVTVTAYNTYGLESPPSEPHTFTFAPSTSLPPTVRILDLTIEVSDDMETWRPVATVWGVELPRAAGFARVRMEERK